MRSIPRPELCLLALSLCAGCPSLPQGPRYDGAGSPTPRAGGTLILWEEQKVRGLDPHVSFDVISGALIELLYDGLYSYDRDTQLVPALAAALPTVSEGGKVFTVPLRRGVRFQNGREVTAQDVVWSLERMLGRDTHSPGVPFFKAVRGLRAFRDGETEHLAGLRRLDRYTVRIELDRPDQSFLHSLAMRFAAPVPREAVEAAGERFRQRPVGTGPYRLASWEPGVRLVLERNPRYYRPARPYIDRIVFEPGLKRETAFLRFLNGDVDIAQRIAPADRTLLRRAQGWRPYSQRYPRPDVYGLLMNCELPPFDNRHVRRAVAFALDRERWARVRKGQLQPTGQIIPPQIPGYDPNLPHRQRYDLARARQELALAGYPDGLKEEVTLWSTDSANARFWGELAQQDLGKIGIRVKLKQVSFPVYLAETGTPRRAQMVVGGWLMDFPDPSNFLFLVHSATRAPQNSSNRSFYGNPTLDALLDRALVETDPVERIRLYREASDLTAREAPWAFFANTLEVHAWQPYVRGYRPHPVYWLHLDDVWLDLPRKRIARQRDPHGLGRRFARLSPLEVPR